MFCFLLLSSIIVWLPKRYSAKKTSKNKSFVFIEQLKRKSEHSSFFIHEIFKISITIVRKIPLNLFQNATRQARIVWKRLASKRMMFQNACSRRREFSTIGIKMKTCILLRQFIYCRSLGQHRLVAILVLFSVTLIRTACSELD